MNIQTQFSSMDELMEQHRLEVEMVRAERDADLLELRVKHVKEMNAREEKMAQAERDAEEGRERVERMEEEKVRGGG